MELSLGNSPDRHLNIIDKCNPVIVLCTWYEELSRLGTVYRFLIVKRKIVTVLHCVIVIVRSFSRQNHA